MLPPHPSFPPRSLVRDGQTSPHRPLLVVSRSTCPPLFPFPHANIFVIGTAVINTHASTSSACFHLAGTTWSACLRESLSKGPGTCEEPPEAPWRLVLRVLLQLRGERVRETWWVATSLSPGIRGVGGSPTFGSCLCGHVGGAHLGRERCLRGGNCILGVTWG